jgi:hypothetical protein
MCVCVCYLRLFDFVGGLHFAEAIFGLLQALAQICAL